MKPITQLQPGPERILRFADMLDGLPHDESFYWDFCRVHYSSSCKSAGCAIGYLRHLQLIEASGKHDISTVPDASVFLGIRIVPAEFIFWPDLANMHRVRPHHVADQLRRYARGEPVVDYEDLLAEDPK